LNAFVVDTNVAIVASCRAQQAKPACVLACVDALEHVAKNGKVILDDQDRILGEYRKSLSPSGQPGLGDVFFKWVWQNRANIERCERVTIHPRGNSGEDYSEFPSDPSLCKFDRSDRKFVAVALGSKNDPEVLNAVDPDWWEHRTELRRCGVRIRFLCPGQFS
jgi:hypothetical protein